MAPLRDRLRSLVRPFLAAGLVALTAGPALGQAPLSAEAHYVVSLGGMNVATAVIELTDDGQRYSMALSASVAGVGNLVASGTASAASAGLSTNPALTSEKFDLETRAQGEVFRVGVTYGGRNVTAFRVDPPVIEGNDRVPLERAHLEGVNDMLAAFVLKGGALDASLCERRLRVFTGLERFDIAMAFGAADEATSPRTGYQGPVILCALDYRPVSGHFASSEITQYLAGSSRILVWYAPLGASGYFIPYRALIGTGAGDLSIVLTAMRH